AALARVLELRHVPELRGAGRDLQKARGGDVTDRQWETRLLAVLAAVLVVFGLVAVYGASSLVAMGGGEVGADFALRQLVGAVVVWTAMLAAKKGEQIRTFQRGLLPFLVILGPLVGLIFLEPNLSMALLVAILAGTVLFTAGARIGHFLLVGVGAAPLAFGAVASAQYR